MRNVVTHTKSTARSQSSRRFGYSFKSHFFATGMSLECCAFRRTCSRFGQFSPNRISRRSLYRSLFGLGVQKGASRPGRGDAAWSRRRTRAIFSGGKTCRLRALLPPNMKDEQRHSERGRVVAPYLRLDDLEKNTRCVRGRNAPATASRATRRRRPRASNPRADPRAANSARFLGPREIAARPRAAPRGRPVSPPTFRAGAREALRGAGPTAPA